MNRKGIFLTIFSLIIAVLILTQAHTSYAASIDKDCSTVEILFARGSGQDVNQEKAEAVTFFDQISERLRSSTLPPPMKYELGTESYGGYQYPAIALNNDQFYSNAIGAAVSGGAAFEYGDSVKQGVGELQSYLSQRYTKCKSAGTKYILGGYSQGAQVIGQALPGIPQEVRDQIVFVGLFGDPKLHYPEGEGWNPPACQGKGYSLWRRAASNCDLDNGSLGSRKPYLPDDMKNKTGLWCYAHDYICDLAAFPDASGHETYRNDGLAIDQAAQEAVTRLAAILPTDTASSIDTTRSDTTGIDTAFVIDATGSMRSIIDQTKQFARDAASKIKAQNGRVALVYFRDAGVPSPAQVLSGFDDPYDTFLSKLDSLTATGGGDEPEAALYGLMTAMNGLSWRNGVAKAAVLLTDASYHDPDTVDGSTLATVTKRSLEIDPVNIYPVVPSYVVDAYQKLADQTAGQVIPIASAGSVADSLLATVAKIKDRPVPILKNTAYKAAPGQEITFDASESYVSNAAITKYDWNFDGDTIFDASTTVPIVTHTYSSNFTGTMQVRVSADNNTVASSSAGVTISSTTAPVLPGKPKNLTATITSTTDNKSTVKLSWLPDPTVTGWAITLNDIPLGTVVKSQTNLEVSDINRTDTVTIGVAGTNAAGIGAFGTITITPSGAISSDAAPPAISTCTQSNFFVRLLCQAIALVKYIVQGVVYYVLPYAL